MRLLVLLSVGYLYAESYDESDGLFNRGPRQWQEIYDIKHDSIIKSVTFSPDGKRAASASSDGVVFIVDVDAAQILYTIRHNGTIHAAIFSPDGRTLVTASEDTTAKIIDVETGTVLYTV